LKEFVIDSRKKGTDMDVKEKATGQQVEPSRENELDLANEI